MESGTSALRVSRIGLPLSIVSAMASTSRFSSIRSAILFRMAARAAGEVCSHALRAAWAASNAFSTSSVVDFAISAMGSALIGLWSTKYFPLTGGVHLPPIKFSYFARTPFLWSVSSASSSENSLMSSATAMDSLSVGAGHRRQMRSWYVHASACDRAGHGHDASGCREAWLATHPRYAAAYGLSPRRLPMRLK